MTFAAVSLAVEGRRLKSLQEAPSDWMPPMLCLKPLQNRVVVVIGASSGAGQSVARRYVERGARVVLADPSAALLIQSAKSLRLGGGSVTHVVADPAKPDGLEAIRVHAELMYGPIDLWIDANRPRFSLEAKILLIVSVGAALFGISRWVRTRAI